MVDLDLHISFTSRIAPHKRSEFVTFPKTLKTKSLHETVKKRCGKSIRRPKPKKSKAGDFDEVKKSDFTNCFS